MFQADKVRGMQNESISWGWTLPVSTIIHHKKYFRNKGEDVEIIKINHKPLLLL